MERLEKHEHVTRFYSFQDFNNFVKEHRNIFADKTIYRDYSGGYWYIIKEINHFQGDKTAWFWLYNFKDYKNKTYYILVDATNKDLNKFLSEVKK